MFSNAIAFNQNLGSWNISNVLDVSEMFTGVRLSTFNYDRLLLGWSALNLKSNLNFNAGSSSFFRSSDARQQIINTYGWSIQDEGISNAFATTWRTNNSGASSANQITIPVAPGSAYNYSIDWGDGTFDSNISGSITHNYAALGEYLVLISGDFPRIFFNGVGDAPKLLLVNQWGDISWASMEGAFQGCLNLDITAEDTPDLVGVQNLERMFSGCTALVGTERFNDWNVNGVNNFSAMFSGATNFNRNIASWNVSSATNMIDMFNGASLFNQDISSWNVSNVLNMRSMFQLASSFNRNIGG